MAWSSSWTTAPARILNCPTVAALNLALAIEESSTFVSYSTPGMVAVVVAVAASAGRAGFVGSVAAVDVVDWQAFLPVDRARN